MSGKATVIHEKPQGAKKIRKAVAADQNITLTPNSEGEPVNNDPWSQAPARLFPNQSKMDDRMKTLKQLENAKMIGQDKVLGQRQWDESMINQREPN